MRLPFELVDDELLPLDKLLPPFWLVECVNKFVLVKASTPKLPKIVELLSIISGDGLPFNEFKLNGLKLDSKLPFAFEYNDDKPFDWPFDVKLGVVFVEKIDVNELPFDWPLVEFCCCSNCNPFNFADNTAAVLVEFCWFCDEFVEPYNCSTKLPNCCGELFK